MKTSCFLKYKIAATASLLAALGITANAQSLDHYYYSGGTASILNDQVGTANGTLYGAASLSGGTSGSALRTTAQQSGLSGGVPLDGMQLGASAVSGITGSFTIENWFQTVTGSQGRQMWVFSDGSTANMIAGLPSDNNGTSWYGHVYGQGGGGGFANVYGTGFTDSTGNGWLDDGGLYQMILTYDGSSLNMYIDGSLAGSTAVTSALDLSAMTSAVVSGGSPWATTDVNMDGYTYSFGIFNGALSSSQVSSVYALGQDATVSQINTAITPVPEPSTLAIIGFGLFGLVAVRRFIKHKSA